jgi:hypothetical protein
MYVLGALFGFIIDDGADADDADCSVVGTGSDIPALGFPF